MRARVRAQRHLRRSFHTRRQRSVPFGARRLGALITSLTALKRYKRTGTYRNNQPRNNMQPGQTRDVVGRRGSDFRLAVLVGGLRGERR